MNLLYFGSLFDVKSQNELASIMLTRTHERGCCLVYDTVTDESTDLLCDKDLDLISELWTMMVSRPADSSLSHKNALERCVEHAKLWLANSDQPIASNCNVSCKKNPKVSLLLLLRVCFSFYLLGFVVFQMLD